MVKEKRQRSRDVAGSQPCEDGGRDWSIHNMVEGCQRLSANSRSDKRQGRIFCESLRGPAHTLILYFQASRPWKNIDLCCFKPPSLWSFVMAVLGNSYEVKASSWLIHFPSLSGCSAWAPSLHASRTPGSHVLKPHTGVAAPAPMRSWVTDSQTHEWGNFQGILPQPSKHTRQWQTQCRVETSCSH